MPTFDEQRTNLRNSVKALRENLATTVDNLSDLGEQMRQHALETGNVHGTTKEHIGLGMVENYGVATTAEVETGEAINKYVVASQLETGYNANIGTGGTIPDIMPPVPISPIMEQETSTLTPLLEGTPFLTVNDPTLGTITRTTREVQVTLVTDADWISPVWTDSADSDDFTVGVTLDPDTLYMWRMRDNGGDWGPVGVFRSLIGIIDAPTFTNGEILSNDVDSITLDLSSFSVNNTNISHTHTETQISRNATFTDLVVDEKVSAYVSKTYTGLDFGAAYYVRVRYWGDTVVSDWSNVMSVTTTIPDISTPSVTLSVVNDNEVRIDTSPYSDNSTLLDQTGVLYQISTDSGFNTLVFNDTLTPRVSYSRVLSFDTLYYVRVKYVSGMYSSGWSTVKSIRTNPDQLIPGEIGPFTYNGNQYYVAPASTRVLRAWGLWGTDTSLPNVLYVDSSTPGNDPNLGDYNTDVLTSSTYASVNDGYGKIGAPAAEYCRSLGDEWYLPSIKELHHVIYSNMSAIDAADTTTGTTLADTGGSWVWSSTEYSSSHAYIQRMSDGIISDGVKSNGRWVVAVRRV